MKQGAFQNKNRENFDTNNICVSEHALENKLPNWFTFISDSKVWKKGTVLIVGDSVVSGLRESKYLVPLLRKRPDKIILHVGTNDAPHMRADEMLEELCKLKSLIWEMLSPLR